MTANEGDARISAVCCDCHLNFLALGAWQTRCRRCYAKFKTGQVAPAVPPEGIALKAQNAALKDEIAEVREQLRLDRAELNRWRTLALSKAQTPPPLPREQWRRFLQLSHPDRHGGSVAAHEATRWLLENRP